MNIQPIASAPSIDTAALAGNTAQISAEGNSLVLEGQIRPIQVATDFAAGVDRPVIDSQKTVPDSPQTNLMRLSEGTSQITKGTDQHSLLPSEAGGTSELQAVASTADAARNFTGRQSSFSQSFRDNEPGSHTGSKTAIPDVPAPTSAQSTSPATDSPETVADKGNSSSSKAGTLPMDQQVPTSQTSSKTDLTVRLQGQSGENINVRVSERGGDIQLSIRSTDQATASALRHELPSIQAGLERSGWQLEASQAGRDSSGEPQGQQQSKDGRGQDPDWKDGRKQQQNSSTDQWFDLNE